MTTRDKKMVKLISILVPALLLAVFYGYVQMRQTKARQAEQRKKAQLQVQQAAAADGSATGPVPGAAPGPVPGPVPTAPLDPAPVPAPAATATPPNIVATTAGLRVPVDHGAQYRRMKAQWGRDPFAPPDTLGPIISVPEKIEAPRATPVLDLKIQISDTATGNSGVRDAALSYGTTEPFDEREVKGVPPPAETGDGEWTFPLPAPKDKPLKCYIVATDKGKLNSQSRSTLFEVLPPPKETVETQIGGADLKLTLRAISWSGNSGVALINSNVCTPGDVIQGCEVINIQKDGVLLKRNGQEIFLQLKE